MSGMLSAFEKIYENLKAERVTYLRDKPGKHLLRVEGTVRVLISPAGLQKLAEKALINEGGRSQDGCITCVVVGGRKQETVPLNEL